MTEKQFWGWFFFFASPKIESGDLSHYTPFRQIWSNSDKYISGKVAKTETTSQPNKVIPKQYPVPPLGGCGNERLYALWHDHFHGSIQGTETGWLWVINHLLMFCVTQMVK